MATVYTVAFKVLVRLQLEHCPLFLLSGLLPWMFFTAALSGASSAIVDNGIAHVVNEQEAALAQRLAN
jgi:ABC-type polysaccharide/polyol phosphate export permease